jgi:SAM-dependent methyltransferase
MAHPQQLQFVQFASRHLTSDWTGLSVVEIGSADVNGSIRPFFANSLYTGVDLAPGPGVDLIGSGADLTLPDGHADLLISCECFEHNPLWCETFTNMHRMTKPGGIVLVTCASRGRREHGTTRTRPDESPGSQSIGWDYYRNLNRGDFERRLDLGALFAEHAFFVNDVSQDLYFVGRKTGDLPRSLTLDLPRLRASLEGANTLVRVDARQSVQARLRAGLNWPLKWARALPDPAFQTTARLADAAEKIVRRLLRGK